LFRASSIIFQYHGAVTETLGELLADLSSKPLLPISLLDYAETIQRQMTGLQSVLGKSTHLQLVLKAHNIEYGAAPSFSTNAFACL
jgi:hypothetical protein